MVASALFVPSISIGIAVAFKVIVSFPTLWDRKYCHV